MTINALRFATFALWLGLAGCAFQPGPSSIRLALDGPPLVILAEGVTSRHGLMDRGCMAGVGGIVLQDPVNSTSCFGTMDNPANDKGRLYAALTCTNGDTLTLVLRNLGPDQGMGIGKLTTATGEPGEHFTVFYHSSEDEAHRRLLQVKEDIAHAREAGFKKKNKKIDTGEATK